jgi:hypothetical protein
VDVVRITTRPPVVPGDLVKAEIWAYALWSLPVDGKRKLTKSCGDPTLVER